MGYRNPLSGPFTVSGGSIDTVTTVTGNVNGSAGSVLGNVLGSLLGSAASIVGNVGGSIVGSVSFVVGNVGGNVSGSVAGSVASVTGNVSGSVASVVGSVASVTGAVGSVTGAVGSVSGNVSGSVASVTGNVSGSTASVTGAVGSVTGNVSGNVVGSVASVTGNVSGSTASVTGAVGSVTGNVSGNVAGSVASVTGNVSGSVASVTGAVGSVTGQVDTKATATIQSVTTFVPIISRDAYYWPGVSGEALAPSRNASVTYSNRLTKACLRLTGTNPGSATLATFPNVSRSPYDTSKSTVNFQWKHLSHNAYGAGGSFWCEFNYGIVITRSTLIESCTAAQLGRGWGIYTNSDGKYHFVISDGVSTKTDVALVTTASYALDTFHYWQVALGNTTAVITLDGTQVASVAQGWSSTAASDAGSSLSFLWNGEANNNSSGTGDCLCEVGITYS